MAGLPLVKNKFQALCIFTICKNVPMNNITMPVIIY